ncbi:hypothetical protein DJ568_13670 [Mucilaginibacter hurinus]|uniref:Outer membrane insertion C-signal n=1 Tax=Mucilaginibacter hurinus TaxID=2201324 RepID=A0A367GNR6_9SPHI|nr:hypothetical protein [Mucilaginibacter hurinus]RCH54333.1 hypothetical protein DJ568_13670 [Mucilaginibacter hurinus]
MKKLILLAVIAVVLSATQTFAQTGTTGVGLGLDFGDGSTLVGPTLKHRFNSKDALQADLLFGADAVWLGGYYQYHQSFPRTNSLQWYLGVGPQFAFADNNRGTFVFLRPMVGLDYTIPSAPISLSFDWRPMWQLNKDSEFEPARFGLGFRYNF